MSNILQYWKRLHKNVVSISAQDLSVLYQNNGLLAIQKPYGLPVQGGPKVYHNIVKLFPELERRLKLPPRSLALANRLDKNVSGVLLLTYKTEMAQNIAELFRERRIVKNYLAILVGNTKKSQGTLQGNIDDNRRKVIQDGGVDFGSEIRTYYKILDNNQKTCMLCSFQTSSGHKHQIRVHASQLLQCPILGDHKYHEGLFGPQPLSLRMLQLLGIEGVKSSGSKRGKIRPWQKGLIPLHLFAQRVLIPGIGENGGDVRIAASLPEYFLHSMKCCDLMFQRDEYEEKMLSKKKTYASGPVRESIFTSKGISPDATGHSTSL